MLFAYRNYEGTPDAEVSPEVEERIEEAIDEFRAGVDDYSIRAVGSAAVELARFGNEYIQRNEPWKLTDADPEAAEQVIFDCVQIAKALAVLFQPVVPGKAQALWAQLGEEGQVAETDLSAALDAPPADFEEPDELFAKIPDERVEELNEKLAERVAENAPDEDRESGETTDADDSDTEDTDDTMTDDSDTTDFEPLADDRISFEEFQDLDVRVGEILTAEGIEGADKLAKLTVDIGIEERQIVAGIKQLHDLDSLPGTKVVVVANLEQAELFGVESNGMVLAAGEEADLLTTHGDAVPGTKVK
jgi:methionyl-tRNA synthetase